MDVLSVIKLLPESNEQVMKFSNNLNSFLDSGNVNPLDVLLCIKGFEKAVKNVKEYLNQLAVDELDKYSEKDVKYKSAELRVTQTGVRYDFSKCNDVEMVNLKIKETQTKTIIKNREDFLKSIKGSIDCVDEETGEVYQIFAPTKSGTTTAKVTLK